LITAQKTARSRQNSRSAAQKWNSNRSSKLSKGKTSFIHGYRSDEHLNLLLIADEFRFATLQRARSLQGPRRGLPTRDGSFDFHQTVGVTSLKPSFVPYNAYIFFVEKRRQRFR